MSTTFAIFRGAEDFYERASYRELTYKLASRRLKAGDDTNVVAEELKAEAEEQPPADGAIIDTAIESLGLTGYELSKVETYLLPTTLNTVTRGIAKKGDEEIRFYIERP